VKSDISVAHRILALFPEKLTKNKKFPDTLKQLGELTQDARANIIKLPNISASIPQLTEAIAELRENGYDVPLYPQEPSNPEEERIKELYAHVLGSAVNPVLREGNSDRRVAGPVKVHAQGNPHKMMKAYPSDSRSHVANMNSGDFFGSEESAIVDKDCIVTIELVPSDGSKSIALKKGLKLEAGEVIDASFMSVKALHEFLEKEIADAYENDILLSLHLKATMMKISDPIIFGHAVAVYFKDVFEKHSIIFNEIGVNPNNGLGDLYKKISKLAPEKKQEIEDDIQECYKSRPRLAMVDSSKGITNLHVPNDVIIDASMPVVVRDGGKMWGLDNQLHDVKCLIPDRSYAGIYNEALKYCKANGAFNPATMGSVSNVGLMAKKAEEYGSHDKTFEIQKSGVVQVSDNLGNVYFKQTVAEGDIWRMCQTKDAPIQDWIELALKRARATGSPTIFWLNPSRGHDASLIKKVENRLAKGDINGLDISIKTPEEAIVVSMERATAGENTISVTGNVLRDYLTDLFPILELGTSAKMLSIVPLLCGGGLYETGAGGSAPKHVQQFVSEGHLRWDSLGEFLALAVSLGDVGEKSKNPRAVLLSETLNDAVTVLLKEGKSPSRKVGEIDNRGSHFYLALYWARALVSQTRDEQMSNDFRPLLASLEENADKIAKELIDCQGSPADIGGYYLPDPVKAEKAMRPSLTLNKIIGK